MRRDLKLAQKKKARDQARTSARSPSGLSPAKAATKPFGPCWLSRSWRDDELPPELVSVVITRDLGGIYIAHVMLVDRTCLGVKNAFTIGPLTRGELSEAVERVGQAHADGMESVAVEDAQSVVFAAIAYAERLGLRPNRDFDARLVGPAPSPLRPTPLAARERPFYVAGPDDDVDRIIAALDRAVGKNGFDVGSYDDDVFDDADGNVDRERREDERRITAAVSVAFSSLESDGALPELELALNQFLRALDVGSKTLPPEHQTSLPSFWAALFRPRADGTRGVDLMQRRHPRDAAFAALGKTRAALFEVLSVLGTVGTCRDVITGEILRVRLGTVAAKATRWMRFFGYLTPMEDGTQYPASTMLGHMWLRNVTTEAWLAKLNTVLDGLKIDEHVDPADATPGLTRWGALAHGVLNGMIAPTPEEQEELNRPIYVVDSDGDRFEFHEATIPVAKDVSRRLVLALEHADDFVAGGGFAWMRKPKERGVVAGEHIAFVERPQKGAIRVTTSSAVRFHALCARLEALAGASLAPSRVQVVRPWEQMPGAVAVETPESRRLVFGSSRVEAGDLDLERLVIDGVRRALDETVPLLEGIPRALVGSEEGRQRVERWLQDQEIRGLPSGNAFLDLDVVRRDLGMRGVFPLNVTGDGATPVSVPDRKISETILELAQPILSPFGEVPELATARSILGLAVSVWNFHAMATPLWGKPEYLAEARAKMRGPGAPREIAEIFESLLARRAERYGDDPRVVGDWNLGPDGRGGHTFRCDCRLPERAT